MLMSLFFKKKKTLCIGEFKRKTYFYQYWKEIFENSLALAYSTFTKKDKYEYK